MYIHERISINGFPYMWISIYGYTYFWFRLGLVNICPATVKKDWIYEHLRRIGDANRTGYSNGSVKIEVYIRCEILSFHTRR